MFTQEYQDWTDRLAEAEEPTAPPQELRERVAPRAAEVTGAAVARAHLQREFEGAAA